MNKKDDTAFFGQPRGLATLSFTEFWERFSYYGMKAILLYYMYFAVSKGGLGMDRATAMSVTAIYGSLVFLSSIIGGFVADRIWGGHRTVFVGGVFIMFGHIVLALPFGEAALFTSIALIVIGTGLLKPNISEMVGGLYKEDDVRRDSGFSILVMGINLGSFIAPLLVGWLGQRVNFHLGFSLAAVGMAIGLLFYWFDGNRSLNKDDFKAPDPLQPGEGAALAVKIGLGVLAVAVVFGIMGFTGHLSLKMVINIITFVAVFLPIAYFVMFLTSKKVSTVERSRVWAYIPLFLAAVIFWAIEEQGSVVLAMFAQNQTRLSLMGFTIPASWFQSLNPLFIILYTPFFARLWMKLGKRQPSSPKKFTYGLIFAGLSFIVMMIPLGLFGAHTLVSPLWLVLSWAVVEIGELLISPVGLSVTTKLAPRAYRSQMMSMWFLSDAAAQAFNAQLVKLYTPDNEFLYFGIVGGVTVLLAVLLIFITPRIEKLMAGVN
ncbi:peptide MFS transporter [Lacticaseibacillus pabuli]|uniref:Peptide MFS transporter n=1 Tax=Lacticaseibacillus pabuli TaxID=3025672 RepID=A0ABY7WTF0_9LACO|nr:peptide MFS transporter [Lacticaseibacillus sp. KACC 23028]WDF83430.1 peptide MFS transporter [Lacticaseibacillus sp. KACC 23028]